MYSSWLLSAVMAASSGIDQSRYNLTIQTVAPRSVSSYFADNLPCATFARAPIPCTGGDSSWRALRLAYKPTGDISGIRSLPCLGFDYSPQVPALELDPMQELARLCRGFLLAIEPAITRFPPGKPSTANLAPRDLSLLQLLVHRIQRQAGALGNLLRCNDIGHGRLVHYSCPHRLQSGGRSARSRLLTQATSFFASLLIGTGVW